MAGGRPTHYKAEYCELATRLAKLGLIDKEIAAALNIAESTLNDWKLAHPEFLESLKNGRVLADANVVEKLYQRAMGYEHPETHVSNYQGEITLTPLIRHYPPDTSAAIFWLKNRQRNLWRNKDEDSNNEGINTVVVDRNGNGTETAE